MINVPMRMFSVHSGAHTSNGSKNDIFLTKHPISIINIPRSKSELLFFDNNEDAAQGDGVHNNTKRRPLLT